MRPTAILIVAPLMWIGGWVAASAATPPSSKTSPSTKPAARVDQVAAIAAQLKSDDPAEVDKGLAAIRQRFKLNGEKTSVDFDRTWCAPLMEAHRYDEAAELCLSAIFARPADLNFVEGVLRKRIGALLAGGRNDEALEAAKGVYNSCWLKRTTDAINLLGDVLAAARPDDGSKAVQQLDDRPQEAMKVFRAADAISPDKSLAAATEGMARAMRAEDGTVGSANAWILSLRPGQQPPPGSARPSTERGE